MASASARRAWNDAMKVTAGAAALPPALQQGNATKRRSDRHRKQDRRIKARKGSLYGSSSNMSGESQADRDYRIALWVDMLEGIDPTANTGGEPDEDEEYDELEEFEESTKKRKKRTTNKRETKKGKSKVSAIPKRYLPKSLGAILLEEAYRPAIGTTDVVDSDNEINAARCFIASEARLVENTETAPILPRRKFCPVTGAIALYTEPKSGVPFTTLRALEQIRERAPVWMMMTTAAAHNNNSVASYYEAVKSIEER
jgi:hypothetical protein